MNNPEMMFLSIAISVGVFLLLREVFCWYFKINQRTKVMKEILGELIKLNTANSDLHTISSEAANILNGFKK